MQTLTVKALNGFSMLSNEELETVDGGENLNELLKFKPLYEKSTNGISIGTGGITIRNNNVDVNFLAELNPPKATVTITIRI